MQKLHVPARVHPPTPYGEESYTARRRIGLCSRRAALSRLREADWRHAPAAFFAASTASGSPRLGVAAACRFGLACAARLRRFLRVFARLVALLVFLPSRSGKVVRPSFMRQS